MELKHIEYPHKNLVPSITRQRCIVEAIKCTESIDDMNAIHFFMEHLCETLDMTPMSAPIVQRVPVLKSMGTNAEDYGVSATQIWLESGVTLHTWPEQGFIDINIETCKPFDPGKVGSLVDAFFGAKIIQVTNITTS